MLSLLWIVCTRLLTPNINIKSPSGFEKWMQPFLLCTAAAKGDHTKVIYIKLELLFTPPQLQHLVEVKHIDINTADYDGRTALHLASEEGHLEVVKYPNIFYSIHHLITSHQASPCARKPCVRSNAQVMRIHNNAPSTL